MTMWMVGKSETPSSIASEAIATIKIHFNPPDNNASMGVSVSSFPDVEMSQQYVLALNLLSILPFHKHILEKLELEHVPILNEGEAKKV